MKLNALVVAATLALGGVALAQQSQSGQQQKQMGQEQMGQQNELTGRVLGTHEKTLYVEAPDGAAIPLQISHETSIDGQKLKKDQRVESHIRKDFKPGEEVRASFQVHKGREGRVENVAKSVSKESQSQ